MARAATHLQTPTAALADELDQAIGHAGVIVPVIASVVVRSDLVVVDDSGVYVHFSADLTRDDGRGWDPELPHTGLMGVPATIGRVRF
jgi:hypothetical protein